MYCTRRVARPILQSSTKCVGDRVEAVPILELSMSGAVVSRSKLQQIVLEVDEGNRKPEIGGFFNYLRCVFFSTPSRVCENQPIVLELIST